jgi:hypothetical protein
MKHSKQLEDITSYIDFLNRRNGELRLEATFYRQCFEHAEKLKERIVETSQDLLHACIIGLVDNTAFDDIRNISQLLVNAVEEFRSDKKDAFNAFVAPYKGSKVVSLPNTSADGWI